MLNKPKYMSPSINLPNESVIDVPNGMTDVTKVPFSCIVDGNEAITKWEIKIYKLSDNTQVFDSGEITLVNPFYPIDNKNKNVPFEVNLIDYKTGATIYSGFENGAEPFYWNITFWGESGTVIMSSDEVFYCNSIPYVYEGISNSNQIKYSYNNTDYYVLSDNTPLQKRKLYFRTAYHQSDGVPLKRYGWRITNESNGEVLVDTISHNQIYGMGDNISTEFDGFINGENYKIELYIETQNGWSGIIIEQSFKIEFDTVIIQGDFDIQPLNITPGIAIDWGDLITTSGKAEGNALSFYKNHPISDTTSVNIPIGGSIVFEGNQNGKKLEISEDAYIVLSFQPNTTVTPNKHINLLDVSGVDENNNPIVRKFSYWVDTLHDSTTTIFWYTVHKNEIVYQKEVTLSSVPSECSWYIAILHPLIESNGNHTIDLTITEYRTDGLLPSDNLYPSETLYPGFGTWTLQGGE